MSEVDIKRLGGRSVLRARSFSSLVVTAGLLIAAYFGGWVLYGMALVSLAFCLGELYGVLAVRGLRPVLVFGAFIGTSLVTGAWLHISWVLYAGLAVGVAGILLLPRLTGRSFLDLGSTALTALYLGLTLAHAILIRDMDQGFPRLLFVLWGVGAADIGGFGLGSLFGKHKVAPRISPAKSWEGYAGGLIAATGAVLLLNVILPTVSWWGALLLGITLASCDLVGDLLASAVKRYAGVKDYGKLLPGQGGLLDRLDGTLFALPVAYALLQLIR